MSRVFSGVRDEVIIGTDGDDLVESWGSGASINTGAGNDSIYARGILATVHGGDGSDYIVVRKNYVAAFGDEGNDALYVDAASSDNALIADFEPETDSIRFCADAQESIFPSISYDTSADGDLILRNSYGTINVTLKGIKDFSEIADSTLEYMSYDGRLIGQRTFAQSMSDEIILVEDTDDDHYIADYHFRASIKGSDERDQINAIGYLSTVFGGDGDDILYANGNSILLIGGDGNDSLYPYGNSGIISDASLNGGAGADNFMLIAAGSNSISSAVIMDFNTDDGDIINIYNANIGSLYLIRSVNDDGDLVFKASDGTFDFTLKDIKDFNAIADINLLWTSANLPSNEYKTFEQALIPPGITKTASSSAYVSSLYSGEVWLNGWDFFNDKLTWSDDAIVEIDARDAVNSGGMLAGNSNDNLIYASAYGNQLWGGLGADTLVGGNGEDIFWIGSNESSAHVENCSASDLVYMFDLDVDEIQSGNANFNGDADGVTLNVDGENVMTIRRSENASTTNVQFIDGTRWSYDYSSGSAQLMTVPRGLIVSGKTVSVSSSYAGDLWLNNSDGWNTNYSTIIDASDDDGIRILAGSANSDSIRAGRNGSTLWGGLGGNDTLLGGDGDDVFYVGQGEGNTRIDDCSSDDLVYLWNVNFSDLKYLNAAVDTSINYLDPSYRLWSTRLTTNDDSFIEVWAQRNSPTTNYQFADGSLMRYNATVNAWQSSSDGTDWQTFNEVNGMPVGVQIYGNTAAVYSDHVGDFSLDELNNSSIVNIDATNDTVAGRVLIGNDNDNQIYAGSGGASIWAGGGTNNIYGGAGDDTFRVDINGGMNLIHQYSSNDVVTIQDFTQVNLRSEDNTVGFQYWTDGTTAIYKDEQYIDIVYGTYGSRVTYLLADGSRYQFYGREGVMMFFIPLEPGLMKYRFQSDEIQTCSVLVSGEYEGALYLDDLEDSHPTSSRIVAITDIDARDDTVAGRILVGNENDNAICASEYGSSLWGGVGGDDTLFGGDGADGFVAGKDEGNTTIIDCADDDLVLLWNINLNDLSTDMSGSSSGINIALNDSTINIARADDASSTTIQFANGTLRRYNYSDNSWT